MHRLFLGAAFTLGLFAAPALGALSVSYTDLAPGTTIDLTATGTLDWVKWGNGENNTDSFLNATKIGNPVFLPATLAPVGTVPPGQSVDLFAFTGQSILNFTWTDGNFGMYNDPGPVDTVVTETISPPQNSYPIGLGASFQAQAFSTTLEMDVYVQGFDADLLMTATLGAESQSIALAPTHNPASDPNNDYAIGDFHISYSGVGPLTISVQAIDPRTDGEQADFANAGFFAATVQGVVPEPSSFALGAAALVALGGVIWRRKRA